MEQKTYDVFISYSRKDYVDEHNNVILGNEVSKIKEALTKAKITYWFDEEGVYAGDKFAKVIVQNIKTSSVFVFLSTKNSNQSEWTANEISTAHMLGKKIIPVRIDDSVFHDDVILYIARLSRIDYFSNPDEGRRELVRSIKEYLEDVKAAEAQKAVDEQRRKEELERQRRQQEEEKKRQARIEKIETEIAALESQRTERKKAVLQKEQELKLAQVDLDECDAKIKKLQDKMQELSELKKEVEEKTIITIRLSKAAKEFNVGKDTIVEFLTKKGFQVDSSPNTKLTGEMYALLMKEYQSEKDVKNEAMRLAKERDNAEEKKRLEEATPKERVFFVGEASFKMIYIEGGTFQMGAQKTNPSGRNYNIEAYDDEIPVHDVKVSSFYMCETVVTQSLWKAVMGSEPTRNGGWEDQCGKGDNYPAYRVSYNDIVNEFIPKLNQLTSKDFRLPTEAEWEYAARGGQKGNNEFKYSGSNDIEEVAWYWKNSGGRNLSGLWDKKEIENNRCRTHPVKMKKPNELGLYDMSGNVWEWCKDWYEDKYYSKNSQENPQGPPSGSNRVLRGGSWDDGPRDCRVSSRTDSDSLSNDNNGGFRLVLPR